MTSWTSWTVAHQAPLYAENLTLNARLYDPQARIKVAGRKISNFRYADDTTLMAASAAIRTKKPLDESDRGE